MICPKCNTKNPDDNVKCSQCGTDLILPAEDTKYRQKIEKHAEGGGIQLGDTGMIKDSTFKSETHIDSHDNIGAPVVGGNQTIIFGKDDTKVTKTGEHCPLCGGLAKDDYFRCRSCGRNFICQKHLDEEHLVCRDCASKLKEKEKLQAFPEKEEKEIEHKKPEPLEVSGKAVDENASVPPKDTSININIGQQVRTEPFPSTPPATKHPVIALSISVAIVIIIGIFGYKLFFSKKESTTMDNQQQVTVTTTTTSPKADQIPAEKGAGVQQGTSQVKEAIPQQPKEPSAQGGILSEPQPNQFANIPLELDVNIIGQRLSGSDYEEVIVRDGSTLRSNDNLQIHLRTSRDCYVYVLMYDSEGKAGLLFPSAMVGMDNRIRGNRDYQIPGGNKWFFLDENTGTETIYVIADLNRMDDIYGLLADMERKGTGYQRENSQKILTQINIRTRGIGGVTTGPPRVFKTTDGDEIRNVTQIVKGKGAVVWSVSFKHI